MDEIKKLENKKNNLNVLIDKAKNNEISIRSLEGIKNIPNDSDFTLRCGSYRVIVQLKKEERIILESIIGQLLDLRQKKIDLDIKEALGGKS